MHSHYRLLDAWELTSLIEELRYSLYCRLLLPSCLPNGDCPDQESSESVWTSPRADWQLYFALCIKGSWVRAQLIYKHPAYLIASFPGESGYRLTKNILKSCCFRPTCVSSCSVCGFDVASGSGWQPGPTNCKPREPEGGVHIQHWNVAGRLLLCCSNPSLDCQIYT